ncbi:MAG: UvrD-helicase domain-containing protein, partial [Clostridiales Family XIII bacterium]|nr:UvrD-helicase domain-containing protein [Clostridiales Family XIII bacterium]
MSRDGGTRREAPQDKPSRNEKQAAAINSDKKRILVSAAAGSGKTAVLVERIGRLITEAHIPLSAMLIVTFTNAAAAEMRQRIVLFLAGKLGEKDIEEAQRAFLRAQLSAIYSAQISTFHAFALAVIREYHFKIGLEPGLRICDEARGTILKNEAAEELFAERFANDYDNFTDFLRHYAGEKNEESLREEMLFAVYDAIRVSPDPFDRLREAVASLSKPAREMFAGSVAAAIRAEVVRTLTKTLALCRAVRPLLETGGAHAYLPLCEADTDGLARLLAAAEDLKNAKRSADAPHGPGAQEDADRLQALLSAVSDFKFATFSVSNKEEKAKYKAIEADVKRLREKAKRLLREGLAERYCRRSLEDCAAEINGTAPYAAYLAGLLEAFHEIFTRKKL